MCWQIDFLKVSLPCENEPVLDFLPQSGTRPDGTKVFYIPGSKKPIITYNPRTRMLKFSASVIFLYQGHNFSFDMADFINAVDDWCQRLGVNLWQGDLDEFEFAAIMEVERPPKEYIAGHPDGYKLKSNPHPDENGYLRTYRDKLVLLKMYDVRRRIMTTIRRAGRGAVMQAGWRPERHYLKFEAHYLNPGNTFNNGRRMILADLIDPARVQQFKEDLCRQYKRLQPMKTLINPSDKKNLSTGEIILIELAEHYFNSGLSLQQVKKRLYARINAYPEPLMLPTDKNARKRKINEWLNKLTFEENSPFDLSGRLQEVLANTGECYPDRDY